jgi:hypothetical protein
VGATQENSLPVSATASSSAMRFDFQSVKKMGYETADCLRTGSVLESCEHGNEPHFAQKAAE